ncbi:RNA polymerase sigma factor [Fulvivirga sediminis]|uniref:Sigma-70 family RNA polymerase sigma factor n=1 Tax=Fulvivirga sediminis TaxID=2803949 RepID=A0A937F938_9BACT|nr:sigma-70 family RNA polymerase sigma factor [Fulvivirga sediminis]MBL3656879.1 sigma-70 family RNA polymerase sigma factor [Fulvivirga sediminis]
MPKQTPDIHEDESLIRAYQNSGDMQVVGVLFKKYMHLVYGVCLKYFKNKEESQDAVMQIFEKLTDKLQTQEVDNFKSWLYVLSKNHCLMQLRSVKYKNQQVTKDIDSTHVESDLLMHHNDEPLLEEDLQELEKCIEELQNEQKRCIELFYLENRSYKEVEEATNYDLKKVKSYIQNGKRNLKICMEKNSER